MQLELNKGVQYQINEMTQPPSQSSVDLAGTLSKSFIALCQEFRLTRPQLDLDPELHMEVSPSDSFMRPMGVPPASFFIKGWSVSSLKYLRA